MGRNDKQIKLKGYRINLLEIENHSKILKGLNLLCALKSQVGKIIIICCSKKKVLKKKLVHIYLKMF